MERKDTCPLPGDPTLAATAVAMRDAGQWGEIFDRNWRIVYMTDELRTSAGLGLELVSVPLGEHVFGREALETRLGWGTGAMQLQAFRDMLSALGPWVLADIPGGRAALAAMVDPRLADIIDGLSPAELPSTFTFPLSGISPAGGGPVPLRMMASRVYEGDGRIAGTALILMPAVGMSVLATMAATGDVGHFQRMQQVAKATRRPAAVLFADLESSSPLARRLSTHAYFSLGRRLARAADECSVDSGGLVGRHVGDGVVAFFLAETAGSESRPHARVSRRRATCARRCSQWPSAASSRPRISSCASAFIGAQPCTSVWSRQSDAQRSPPSAMRSTRARGSRRAPQAGARLPPRSSWSASSPTTPPRSPWTPDRKSTRLNSSHVEISYA